MVRVCHSLLLLLLFFSPFTEEADGDECWSLFLGLKDLLDILQPKARAKQLRPREGDGSEASVTQ